MKITPNITLLSTLLFITAIILYTFTLFPGIGGGGDSAEFQISGKVLGLSHPTGYALYHLINFGLSYIPVSTLAKRISFFSGFCMALSAVFLFIISFRITGSALYSFLGSVLFIICSAVWINATIAEVYALQFLIATLIFYSFFAYLKTYDSKWFYWLAFFLGLSLIHHLMSAFILAGILLSWPWKSPHQEKPVTWLKAFLCFLLPLLFLIYFPLRVSQKAHSFDMYTFQTFNDYLRYWLGGTNVNLLNLSFSSFIQQSFYNGAIFYLQLYGVLPAGIAIIGMYEFLRNQKKGFLLLFFLFLVHIALAGIWTESDKEAILTPSIIVSTIFLAYGSKTISQVLFSRWQNKNLSHAVVITLLVAFGITQWLYSYKGIAARNDHYDAGLIDLTYKALPEESILLTAYWENTNMYKYVAWSGEYGTKKLHIYRWNDPRYHAGFTDILGYLQQHRTIGTEGLSPEKPFKIFFLEPVAPNDINPAVTLIPIQVKENRFLYEARLTNEITKTIPLSLIPFETLDWKWSKPVLQQTLSGHPLAIAGNTYANGYGIHGGTILRIPVPENATHFIATMGISGDLQDTSPASVCFILRCNDKMLWQSPVLRRKTEPVLMDYELKGEKELTLEVSGTEDGLMADHAVLAEPQFHLK